MWQLPKQALPIKAILASSYAFLKANLMRMWVLIAIFFIWPLLPFIGLLFSSKNVLTGDMRQIKEIIDVWMQIKLEVLIEIAIWFVIFALIYLVVVILIYGAVYHRTHLLMHQHIKSVSFSLCAVLRKLPFLFIALILGLITNLLGYVIFIIPGIYLITVITLYYPLIIIDNLNPITGFKRAFALIRAHWWRTSIVLLVPVLVLFLLMLVTHIAVAVIGIIFHVNANSNIMNFVYVALETMGAALFLPISAAVTLLQINDLKLRQLSSVNTDKPASTDQRVING